MKLDCLVVDDEPNAGKLLEDYINKIPGLTLVARCFDGKEALEVIRNRQVDLLFLDINMPNLTGIELISFIPKELPIVFTTAYSEYAIESYEYNVIDYLLKPITFNRFMKAIGKAEEQISGPLHKKSAMPEQTMADEGYFFVRADKKMIKINFRSERCVFLNLLMHS